MCLKPQPSWPMPEDTGRISTAPLDTDSTSRLVGKVLFAPFHDEMFATLSPV